MHVARNAPHPADAIFALTEWATRGASHGDLEGSLRTIETLEGPLTTIVTRVLLHPSRESNGKRSQPPELSHLFAGCANLVTNLLLLECATEHKPTDKTRSGGAAAHSSMLKKIVTELLFSGRALVLKISDNYNTNKDNATFRGDDLAQTPQKVATSVSICVLELLQRVAKEKHARESGEEERGREVLQRLEAELSVLDRASPQRNGVKEKNAFCLLARRDATKRLADASGRALDTSLVHTLGKRDGGVQNNGDSIEDGTQNCGAEKGTCLKLGRKEKTRIYTEHTPDGEEHAQSNQHIKEEVIKNGNGEKAKRAEIDEGTENNNGQVVWGDTQNGVAKKEPCLEVGEEIYKQSRQLPLPKFESSKARQELASQIIGRSPFKCLADSKEQIQSLQTKMQESNAEISHKRNVLSCRQSVITLKRTEIKTRMAELQKELCELEVRNQQLAEEEDQVKAETEILEVSLDSSLVGLNGKLKVLENGAHAWYGEVCGEAHFIAEKMAELEKVWLRSFTLSVAATLPPPPPPEKAAALAPPQNTLDCYLRHVRSYVRNERQLLRLLRRRAAAASSRVTELEHELSYSRALGMGRSVELMSNDLRILQTHVSEDMTAIAASTKAIEDVQLALIERVEGCRKKGQIEKCQSEIFDKIAQDLKNIETSTVLAQDAEEINVGSHGEMEPPSLSSGKAAFTMLPDNPTQADRPALLPALAIPKMPKLSWASEAKGTIPKKKITSLLDIQREEMLEKKGSEVTGAGTDGTNRKVLEHE